MRNFRDIDAGFGVHPETKDVLVKTNSSAVSQSIRNLVLSNKYDHPFQPSVGADVGRLLFEPDTSSNREALSSLITEVINNHEPRVRVQRVDIESTKDGNNLNVTIVYYEAELPTLQSLRVTIQRVR